MLTPAQHVFIIRQHDNCKCILAMVTTKLSKALKAKKDNVIFHQIHSVAQHYVTVMFRNTWTEKCRVSGLSGASFIAFIPITVNTNLQRNVCKILWYSTQTFMSYCIRMDIFQSNGLKTISI